MVSDALYIAARSARPRVVEFLLERGADVSFRAYLGATALHWAHFGGSREVIEMLERAGADQQSVDDVFRCEPRAFGICVPANWGILHLVRARLAEDKTLANIQGGRGTPLHEAARGGNPQVFGLLLTRGANLAARDPEGNLAVDLARNNNHLAIVQIVEAIQRHLGALVKKKDWQPIMNAAFAGDAKRVESLLKSGINPNVQSTTTHRHRPLLRAIEHKKSSPKHTGHERVVKLLLNGGADPKRRGTMLRVTALELAAIGEPRFIPLLRAYFEPLDIFHAAAIGDLERVKKLLSADSTLATARDANGMTPLHYSAASAVFKSGQAQSAALVQIAQLLLGAGADPNATYLFDDQWPLPVLYGCCGMHDNPDLAKILLDAGADPCDGESIFHAADEGHARCLALFELEVNRKKLAAECTRALPTLLSWRRSRGAAWLLEHGADPNVLDAKRGENALHTAIKSGMSAKVVKLLLDHGADPRVKTSDGKPAVELARAAKNRDVLRMLQGHKSK